MDNKKFEQLIELIINEDEDRARELFHDIVVEKSREIYESIMDEEMMGQQGGGMVGEVGDLLDEINAEEAGGMTEDDEEVEIGDDDGDEVIDIDSDELGDEGGEGAVEDAVIRIEDKLDQLMAEFEEIMGGGEEDFGGDEEGEEGEEDFGGEEGEEDFGGEEDMMEAEPEEDAMEESVMENIQLKNVPGLYGSKIGGDNGVQTKSPTLQNSGQAGMDSKPVKFAGASESVPTGPKEPSGYAAKGKTQVKDASNWKNAPAQDAGKTSFKDKASRDWGKKDSSTGKEVGAGGSVAQNDKSVVAESRKATRKIVR
jgi:hypothetical protein